jgi:hypothetical protein
VVFYFNMITFRIPSVIITAIIIFLFILAISPVTASAKKAPPPIDTRILIKSVDVKDGTIEFKYMRDAKEPTHFYKIDDLTDLKVNYVKGTINQIKPGMEVKDYLERDDQSLDSVTLSGYGEETIAKPIAKPKPKPKPTPST